MEVLLDDILIYIFSLMIINHNYLLINKRILRLKNNWSILRYQHIYNNSIHKDRDAFITYYLHDYSEVLKQDPHVYRRYILQFMFNKDREITTYICKYKHHELATNFCENIGLKYEVYCYEQEKQRYHPGIYDGYGGIRYYTTRTAIIFICK